MKMFTGKELFDSMTGIDKSMRALKEVAAPRLPQQSEVGCSEWVAELEAALNHVGNALDKCPPEERRMAYLNALKAGTLLLNAVNSERSRSATLRSAARKGAL